MKKIKVVVLFPFYLLFNMILGAFQSAKDFTLDTIKYWNNDQEP